MYKIEEFISLIHNHNFIEAHEVLEDDWKSLKKSGDKRTAKYIQGLINATTSIALFIKGRPEAGEKVWGTFIKYKDLIDEVDVGDKTKYKEATKLLFEKYNSRDDLC